MDHRTKRLVINSLLGIWLNTWNNWPETTTFEPTISQDPKYPAGNYGFDLVEVIRDVFGAKTFSN